MHSLIPVFLNNSSMIILYKALFATGRISLNVSQSPLKTLSSQLTLFHVKVFHRISGAVVKSGPKWHVLAATPVTIFLYNRFVPGVAQCKTRPSTSQQLLLRKAHRNASSGTVVQFNWTRLMKMMLPDILLLAGAIVVCSEMEEVIISCNFVFRVQYLLLLSISEYHFFLVT